MDWNLVMCWLIFGGLAWLMLPPVDDWGRIGRSFVAHWRMHGTPKMLLGLAQVIGWLGLTAVGFYGIVLLIMVPVAIVAFQLLGGIGAAVDASRMMQ